MTDAYPKVFSVTQLNKYVKGILDGNEYLSQILVSGEISNFKAHYSGHYYMTIKDDNAAIKAVMFAGNASRLRFKPENGLKVIILGKVSMYEKDGTYQLYITSMQPDGLGSLNLAYEQLKKKLSEEGLFDVKYKKKLPFFPQRVGVITSQTGAAVRDIINVISRRCPSCQIILKPVCVQGETAAPEISKAVSLFNKHNAADVLIVGRGGGSIEDLWAFNEELTARSIFESKIPVISAVGHETDTTICDFVADLRAPTPSAAAELAVPDVSLLNKQLEGIKNRLIYLSDNRFSLERERLIIYENTITSKNPITKIKENKKELKNINNRLNNSIIQKINSEKLILSSFAKRLNALNPLSVIERGFSITYKESAVVSSVKAISEGDTVSVKLADGGFSAEVIKICEV